MADKNLKEHLADYYGEQSLPESVASRLEQAADPTGHAGTAHGRAAPRSTRMDVRTKALIACVLALVLLAVGLMRQVNRLAVEVTDLRRQAPTTVTLPATKGDADQTGDVRLSSMDRPNLVAVYVYADWCPRCPIVGPIYGEIAEKYGADDVLFVKLDTTDGRTRHQMSLLADVLNIKWLPPNQRQSGMITLIDREQQTVLATLTGPEQLRDLEDILDQALRSSQSP